MLRQFTQTKHLIFISTIFFILMLFGCGFDEDNILTPKNDYEVTGDFWNHEYKFVRKEREVAYVSKEYFRFKDTYGIDIVEGEDDITILATAVVIDLVNQSERR